jgi:hypothetical protein
MNRINTQLPQVPVPQPPKTDWFSRHYMWGYAFLFLAFLLAIAFIYQMEYGHKPKENTICIQIVTSARNPQSGKIEEFPTPCDVPQGWEKVDSSQQEGNGLRLIDPSQSGASYYSLSSDCSYDQCTMLITSSGKTEVFTNLFGLPNSILPKTGDGLAYVIIGWDNNSVVIEGTEADLCAGYSVLYKIDLPQKTVVELDSTDPGCKPDIKQQEDKEEYDKLIEELRSTLVDPRLI